MSYYHRGDFLSDLGAGISKVSSFANFIPGVGSAIGAVGGLLGGGISAIGSLFGGGGPPPLSQSQFENVFTNTINQVAAFSKKFAPPMTSPGAPVGESVAYPETRPPTEFYASTPDVDYSDYDEEDYG